MIYKIGNIADMKNLPPLEKHFALFLTNCARDLTKVYGAERNIDNDDGGYLLYVEKGTPHDEIQKCFDYTAHTLEYANILGNQRWIAFENYGCIVSNSWTVFAFNVTYFFHHSINFRANTQK